MFSKGFLWRLGTGIKERGDRIGHVKVFGVFIFGWLSCPIRQIGFAIKKLA